MTRCSSIIGRPPPATIGPESNVVNFFLHWVERAPDRPAIVFPSRGADGRLAYDVVTFRGLDRDSGRLAHGLARLGVRRGDRVLVMVPMSRPLYTLLVALMKLGACAVFVDPWAVSQLGRAADLVRPKAFVGVPLAHLLRLRDAPVRRIPLKLVALSTAPWQRLLGRRLEDLLRRGPTAFPTATCGLDDPALITFTTGSTGAPKGANRTQRFLNAQGVALDHHLRRVEGDVDMPALPIFVLNNLGAGVPSVLPLVNFMRIAEVDPATIVQEVRDWQVTTIGGSPAYLLPIARWCVEQGVTLDRVRGVVAGGAPVPPRLLALLQRCCPNARGNIEVLYGSTEAEPVARIEADEVLGETAAETERGRGNCVGAPVPDVEVKLVHARTGPLALGPGGWTDLEVAPGEVGEVLVTGDHVQRDYYRNPEAVRSNKLTGPDGRVWHRMGDLAWRDARDRLWLVGRNNDAVPWRGRTLYPIQVEGRALSVEGVRLAGLVEVRGEAVLALVLEAGFAAEVARARVLAALDEVGLGVDRVVVVDAIPLDPRHNAKVERAALRARLA
ncbi:MAG: AMP-binding protein [Planctomycetes bacterium]|nr:AMP-binding protein [Planctomycetota bacterium]